MGYKEIKYNMIKWSNHKHFMLRPSIVIQIYTIWVFQCHQVSPTLPYYMYFLPTHIYKKNIFILYILYTLYKQNKMYKVHINKIIFCRICAYIKYYIVWKRVFVFFKCRLKWSFIKGHLIVKMSRVYYHYWYKNSDKKQ